MNCASMIRSSAPSGQGQGLEKRRYPGCLKGLDNGPAGLRREHQKPWGSSGCGGEWGELDIVNGHGRIPGGEQVAQRAIEGAGSGLQEPMSTFL
jgi:hypothetical protein